MKKIIIFFSTVLLVLSTITPLLEAQACFRGKPSPDCKLIFLTEAEFASSRHGRQFTWESGGLYNLHKHHALGATFFTNIDNDEDFGSGLKARYRYWLNRSFSFDVAPGLLLTRRYRSSNSPNFFGHVGLNYRDWVALIFQIDTVRKSSPVSQYTNYSMGIKVGSYAGLAIIAGSVVVLGVLYLVLPYD